MKLNGNAVKPGNVIEHNGRLWTAVKVSHVKPGKGGAITNHFPIDGDLFKTFCMHEHQLVTIFVQKCAFIFIQNDAFNGFG